MMLPTLMAFGVALVASLALTGPVRLLALHIGLVDYPGPRKLHLTPMPLLGGIAIYGGVLLALLVSVHGRMLLETTGILGGATLLVIVGILDDRGLLHHQVKLFLAMPVAAVILLASGIRANVFSAFVPGAAGIALDACLTVVWVVGIAAAFSILDHMDGLCTGVAAVAAAYFTLFAWMEGQILVRVLAAATLGAAVGFLRWNFHPARIFMGDGGAMFLGFLMATLGLKLRMSQMPAATAWMVPVLVLAVPILDTLLVSISRSRRGMLPFSSPGKDHTAHRLSNLGLGRSRAVVALYALGCVGGGLAWITTGLSVGHAYAVFAVATILALVLVVAFERVPYERQQKP
jgi:UDP-GlcNAc:undecaprenyl-phosphate/decaprenyl-phosphate GlcNAc-1-phosphate transferase